MLVYYIHKILPKEWILCEGLFVFPLKALNVTRPRPHREVKRDLFTKVVSHNLDKAPCGVTELLG